MKKALGLLMVLMLLSWSVAAVHPVKATPTTKESAYEAFWDILNREAELYAQTASGNSSALGELLDNSRLGAENAVNISTLIWESIEELRASGVKTYYTANELREMAEQVSKNGLPNETVEELKAQGWTDEQIKALEDYIAKNADNITGDFNMTAFLQNLSTAFMRVAFKYNHYWAYGLEKLLNQNSSSLDVPRVVITEGSDPQEVPVAWDMLTNFTSMYKNADITGRLVLVRKLEKSIINMSRDTGWKTLYSRRNMLSTPVSCQLVNNSVLLRDALTNARFSFRRLFNNTFTLTFTLPVNSLPKNTSGYYYEAVDVRSFASGDYIIVEVRKNWSFQKVLDDCSIQTASGKDYTVYYWRAFQTLEALKNLESLLEAINRGNGNPDLKKLEANLTRSLPELFKTNRIGYYWWSSTAFTKYAPKKLKPIPGDPQPRAVEGTSPTSSDASLDLGVEVSAANVTENYATYKVTVALQAVGGSVSDVNVSVNGDGLSDSKHYAIISEDDGVVRWTTKTSSKIHGSGSVNVSGTVDVWYSIPHAIPTSVGLPRDAGVTGSDGRNHVKKDYSKTIRLGTPVDPDKVTFEIVPSDSTVRPGSNVTFRVQVINNNDVPINADYTLDVAYPLDEGSATASFSNGAVVHSGEPWVDVAGRVYYPSTGTFHYSGELSFDGFSKTAEGDVVVSLNSNSSGSDPASSNGSLRIVGVSPEPSYPREGDTVSFKVGIDSSYSGTEKARVKLYVDDELKDSRDVDIGSSGASLTLHWPAVAGEHSYEVKVYRLVDGQELFEDSWSGRLKVYKELSTTVSMEIECPSRVGLGDSFECLLKVENDNSETIEVQLNNITFNGRVKREEADMNHVRFQRLEGVFRLDAFKEVPPHSSRSIPVNLGRVDNDFASHFGLSDNHLLLSSTVQGDVNPNVIHQVAYWDTEYSITLRLDVFDKNGNVLFKDKALTTSTTFFYAGSAQAKTDHKMKVQRLKNFGENAIKVIVVIVTVYYSKGNLGDKLWEFVKSFWG